MSHAFDVLAVALAVVAATVLLDEAIGRARTIAAGAWLAGAAVLAGHHGLFPGLSYALAALTAALSLAILAAPLAPGLLRIARGAAALLGVAAIVAGVVHG